MNSQSTKISDIRFPRYSLEKDGITQSYIMSFLKCRREFMFILNRWTPIERRTTFLNGSITHDVLDKIYTYFVKHNETPKSLLIKKWIEEYQIEDIKKMRIKSPTEEINLIKSVVYVITTEYLRFYREDFKKDKVIASEEVFDFIWNGYRLRGKKDLKMRINSKKWNLETKTMARIEEDTLTEKISFDFQNLFYILAEEYEYKEPVVGTIYNVIRNPGHKPGTGETIFQFSNRLRKEIRKNPNHFFKRWEIPYSPQDKKEFNTELKYKLDEIDALLKGKLKIYKNEKNCVTRFRCSFLKACSCGKMVGYEQHEKLFKELEVPNV